MRIINILEWEAWENQFSLQVSHVLFVIHLSFISKVSFTASEEMTSNENVLFS